ncbi:hypothetical protein HS088_TW13G00729 [Tripterygium wilfordii]|uniref:Transcription elongation factor Eaf N-terminal domain-containing protein n=1 Tax=Tripterygium wilfordii TaxID=458696 RepID=A0A7J7CV12_TRIWF|nr:ELL-associated factor 2-like [Tripterygium wilfordii]KAF5737838.1 hypothetical protein HS088_TW13G00729 [Tripterygium wilfordii]
MSKNNKEEPETAPQPDTWYNITLGSSFKDHHPSSTKFCTLRYDFKPASIDKSQGGSLHKSKENRVTVEFQNNQQGKPRVTFEGVSEDYKENDAVLFFDGENFRLERLHQAVAQLRHVRDSAVAAATTTVTSVAPSAEYPSTSAVEGANMLSPNKGLVHEDPVEVKQIDIASSDCLEPKKEKGVEDLFFLSHPSTMSPKDHESEELVDIFNDADEDGGRTTKTEHSPGKKLHSGIDIDINLPHQIDTDDEIADVDVTDDEANKGPNAAEALRAQVNAEGRKDQTSTSSSSSDSESSGSGSRSESGSSSRSGSGIGSVSSGKRNSDGNSCHSI